VRQDDSVGESCENGYEAMDVITALLVMLFASGGISTALSSPSLSLGLVSIIAGLLFVHRRSEPPIRRLRALSIVTEFFEPANVLSVARSTRPPT
jgi:hypothetical protein